MSEVKKIYVAYNLYAMYTIGAYTTPDLALIACERVQRAEDTPYPVFKMWEDGDGFQHWTAKHGATDLFEVEELPIDHPGVYKSDDTE